MLSVLRCILLMSIQYSAGFAFYLAEIITMAAVQLFHVVEQFFTYRNIQWHSREASFVLTVGASDLTSESSLV